MDLKLNVRGRTVLIIGVILVLVVLGIVVLNYSSFFSRADVVKVGVAQPSVNSKVYYVSPTGTGNGLAKETPTTLEGARDKIRLIPKDNNFPGAIVNILGGTYYRTTSFDLIDKDSGTKEAPVVYQAYQNEKPIFTGAKEITGFVPANDSRLNSSAKANIKQVDLMALGIKDYGTLKNPSSNYPGNTVNFPMELFFNNDPMTLARYPNLGPDQTKEWAYLGNTTDPAYPTDTTKTVLKYADSDNSLSTKINGWVDKSNVWMHGYWANSWADNYQQIASIDTVTKTITSVVPTDKPQTTYKTGQNFYFENALEELDTQNEWYVSKEGILYFYPPSALSGVKVSISVLSSNLVNGRADDLSKKVSNVQFIGLSFNGTRAAGIVLNGDNNVVTNCEIYNTGTEGALMMGQADTVQYSKIYNTGKSGVDLRSPSIKLDGDFGRMTLTPGGSSVTNNDISNFGRWSRTSSVGVYMIGVQNLVAHNYIHDGPKSAINFGGNDNTIEYNKISNVDNEVNDGGAIYGGQNWTMRGNKIQFNTISNIKGIFGQGAIGVYFDDMLSGNTIYGNIFKDITTPLNGGAVVIGGGRDNTVKNNIFVNCTIAIHVDARGLNWAACKTKPKADICHKDEKPPVDGILWDKLQFILSSDKIKALYLGRYPEMASLLDNTAGQPLNESVNNPGAPVKNVIASNINLGGTWVDWSAEKNTKTPDLRAEYWVGLSNASSKNVNDAVKGITTRATEVNPFINPFGNDFHINPAQQAIVDAISFKTLGDLPGTVGPGAYVAPGDHDDTAVHIFKGANYDSGVGSGTVFALGDYNKKAITDKGIHASSIQSLKVAGGYILTAYDADNFTGNKIVWDRNTLLTNLTWNKKIVSFRVQKNNNPVVYPVIVYTGGAFDKLGTALKVGSYDATTLTALGIGPKTISSVAFVTNSNGKSVSGYSIKLFPSNNFKGSSIDLNSSVFDLSKIGKALVNFNDQTVSLQVCKGIVCK